MGKAAYDKGYSDGKHGGSQNPYPPDCDERGDYRDGNEQGKSDLANDEAND